MGFHFSDMSTLFFLTAWLAILAFFVIAFYQGKAMSLVLLNFNMKLINVVQNVKYAGFYVNEILDVVFVDEH